MEIIYPVFAMVVLTIAAILIMGARRFAAVRDKKIDPNFFRAYQGFDEPESLRIVSRHVINLFETPVLFYVGAIFVLITGQTNSLLLTVSWLYVLTRYAHTYIHLTSNAVMIRFRLYLLSLMLLLALWVIFMAGLVSGGGAG